MANVNPKFKLKSSQGQNKHLIQMKVYYRTKRFVYSFNGKVKPEDWNEENETAIVKGIKEPLKSEYKDINYLIDKSRTEAITLFQHYSTQGIFPTPAQFKRDMDKSLNRNAPDEKPRQLGFFDFAEIFIDQSRVLKKDGVIRGYQDTINKLTSFQTDTKYKVDFPTINLKFYHEFVSYLEQKNNSINTIGQKHIKNLKAIVHAAEKRGIPINKEIDDREFKKLSAETDKIYLTEDEVKKIYDLDLSNKKRLERVRDMFILGCKTAKRYGDYSKISKEHIIESEGKLYLNMRMQKGDRRVVVPASRIVLQIVEKYNYELPRPISNQKANVYLKEIGQLAKIDDDIRVTTYKGLLRKDLLKKKYELIGTHTARRTGATNMYLAGIPAHSIMKLTGHKTEKEFLRYIRADELVHAMTMADNKFFQD